MNMCIFMIMDELIDNMDLIENLHTFAIYVFAIVSLLPKFFEVLATLDI